MNKEDTHFIQKYEELLDKGYCNCNEMNCIDNNPPRRILNIVKDLQQQLSQSQENLDKALHKLNDIAFGDDSELALRFLRKIGYVDFDDERKVYINKHNNEPFWWKDEQEKDYYLKDEELNEYIKQLEYKLQQREKAVNEIREFIKEQSPDAGICGYTILQIIDKIFGRK